MIKCKKCGIVIGDNGYGYCEPCYFGLPDTAKFYNSGHISGFTAGRADGVRECVEFLEKNAGKLTLGEIIAAIEGVKEGKHGN
jgi:hypothetical protein